MEGRGGVGALAPPLASRQPVWNCRDSPSVAISTQLSYDFPVTGTVPQRAAPHRQVTWPYISNRWSPASLPRWKQAREANLEMFGPASCRGQSGLSGKSILCCRYTVCRRG